MIIINIIETKLVKLVDCVWTTVSDIQLKHALHIHIRIHTYVYGKMHGMLYEVNLS